MVHPYLDHDGPIAFAHRGGALEFPENTMAAFGGAVELGYHYLETDVHVTADGAVVAFHDDILDRVTDCTGVVRELPLAEIRRARIDGEHEIPLMAELFEAFPDVKFNIDAKHDDVVGPLLDLVADIGAEDRVCVAAFELERIERVRGGGVKLCTALAPGEIARLLVYRGWDNRGDPSQRCAQVSTHHKRVPIVTRRFLRITQRRGIPVHVWTIDDRARMEQLLDLGVHGLMTDRPSLLKEVLVERGQWPSTG